jgi:hypothetical protein
MSKKYELLEWDEQTKVSGEEKTPTPVSAGSTKHDDKKPRPELIPADVLVKVAEVLADGARRYGARNWSEGGGFQWSRLQGATMRHLLKFASGVDKDPDSGLDHLAHGICSLMFLYAHQLRNLGTDDRDKTERKIED